MNHMFSLFLRLSKKWDIRVMGISESIVVLLNESLKELYQVISSPDILWMRRL